MLHKELILLNICWSLIETLNWMSRRLCRLFTSMPTREKREGGTGPTFDNPTYGVFTVSREEGESLTYLTKLGLASSNASESIYPINSKCHCYPFSLFSFFSWGAMAWASSPSPCQNGRHNQCGVGEAILIPTASWGPPVVLTFLVLKCYLNFDLEMNFSPK